MSTNCITSIFVEEEKVYFYAFLNVWGFMQIAKEILTNACKTVKVENHHKSQ